MANLHSISYLLKKKLGKIGPGQAQKQLLSAGIINCQVNSKMCSVVFSQKKRCASSDAVVVQSSMNFSNMGKKKARISTCGGLLMTYSLKYNSTLPNKYYATTFTW